jgi:hypothetical protein
MDAIKDESTAWMTSTLLKNPGNFPYIKENLAVIRYKVTKSNMRKDFLMYRK